MLNLPGPSAAHPERDTWHLSADPPASVRMRATLSSKHGTVAHRRRQKLPNPSIGIPFWRAFFSGGQTFVRRGAVATSRTSPTGSLPWADEARLMTRTLPGQAPGFFLVLVHPGLLPRFGEQCVRVGRGFQVAILPLDRWPLRARGADRKRWQKRPFPLLPVARVEHIARRKQIWQALGRVPAGQGGGEAGEYGAWR